MCKIGKKLKLSMKIYKRSHSERRTRGKAAQQLPWATLIFGAAGGSRFKRFERKFL
jgi:hypothetical protein